MGLSRLWIPAALVCAGLAGCGGGGGGPTTYELSGTVTYDGKPVPLGTVTLSPDASKGNKGPGAAAGIKDGQYTTERGRGHIGGAYLVQVTGYDGIPVEGGEGMDPTGTELFPPYETTAEFPNSDHQFDIPVP